MHIRLLPRYQLLSLVLLLLMFGHLILFSASGILGLERFNSEFYYLFRQAMCAGIGVVGMLLIAQVPYQAWQKFALLLLVFQIFLVALTHLPHIGHFAQGATRWIRIGSVRFQPSELAKITVPVYVAALLVRHRITPLNKKQLFTRLSPLALLLALIMKQPDMGTTVLLASVIMALYFIYGASVKRIALLALPVIAFFIFSMLTSDYRRRRLFAFLNPWEDPHGTGFQLIQSFLSIHSGQMTGVGLGNGNSKLFYLPEVHTDFIFSLVAEELGFIGGVAFLLAFAYFSFLLFRGAARCKDPFGMLLGFGLSLALSLQVAINLGGVTGILPVKGLPLPFLSWGRSALLVDLAMVGILLNIIRQSEIIPQSSTKTRPAGG